MTRRLCHFGLNYILALLTKNYFHQVYATKIYFGDFVMFYGFFNIHLCLRSWKKIKEQSDYGYLPRSEIRRIWTILKDAIAIFNRKL